MNGPYLGDDDQDAVWDDLSALDDARLTYYSRTGHYVAVSTTATIERARRYLAKVPPAISGKGGRATFWHAVMVAVHGFDLAPQDAEQVIREWNRHNQPPFDDHEVLGTVWRAHRKKDGPRGHLLRGDAR